jgi:8-oxo-dGTP pyrophosphatase MutT (NUDIX family)
VAGAALAASGAIVAYSVMRKRSRSTSPSHGNIVIAPHLTTTVSAVHEFAPFREWLTTLRENLLGCEDTCLRSITVRDVYTVGNRILFLFLDVDVTMRNVRLPGAVLLRGATVAVMLWYTDDDGNVFVVMVRQPRVATGRMTWEVPAGMIRSDGDIAGSMFDEIREETGLTVNVADLTHHRTTRPFTSSGILDERVELFSLKIDPSIIPERLVDVTCGNLDEGELVTNVVALCIDDPRVMDDAKFHMLTSVVDPE